jgi:hypothetical protein
MEINKIIMKSIIAFVLCISFISYAHSQSCLDSMVKYIQQKISLYSTDTAAKFKADTTGTIQFAGHTVNLFQRSYPDLTDKKVKGKKMKKENMLEYETGICLRQDGAHFLVTIYILDSPGSEKIIATFDSKDQAYQVYKALLKLKNCKEVRPPGEPF